MRHGLVCLNLFFPKFSWEPVLFMIPVAIAPVIEHIGDVYVVNTVAGKDFVKDPRSTSYFIGRRSGLFFAGLVGGPPVTTYSEVTGAMSLTKITNPQGNPDCRVFRYLIFCYR